MNEPIVCDGKAAWKRIFHDLQTKGLMLSPRGQKTLEIENYTVELDPLRDRFCSFDARNFSMKYLAGEFAWYLSGDRDDRRIEHYSSFWGTMRNEEPPFYNSNYGHYFFTEGQLDYCFATLIGDKDSRQACVNINRREVSMSSSKDKLCTNAVMFRIRDNKLNMTVQMRSNDVIFGLGYDAPMFCFIYEMLYVRLRDVYPDLEIGRYFHTSGSFHIYERHFEMMEQILSGSPYTAHNFPRLQSADESWSVQWYLPNFEEIARLGGPYTEAIAVNLPEFTQKLIGYLRA